jgi:signal peptidase I
VRADLANCRRREQANAGLNFASTVSSALAMWKGLSLVTNTESPIVVVLSGSMEPGFRRGDLLFLTLPPRTPLRVGDITVYNVPGAAIPIVHRIIEVHDEYVALFLDAEMGSARSGHRMGKLRRRRPS